MAQPVHQPHMASTIVTTGTGTSCTSVDPTVASMPMTMTTVTTTTTTTTATVSEAVPGTLIVAGDSVNVTMVSYSVQKKIKVKFLSFPFLQVTSEGGADVLETGGDLAIDVTSGSTP